MKYSILYINVDNNNNLTILPNTYNMVHKLKIF